MSEMIKRLSVILWLLPALILTTVFLILFTALWIVLWFITGKAEWSPAEAAFYYSGGDWIMDNLVNGYLGI